MRRSFGLSYRNQQYPTFSMRSPSSYSSASSSEFGGISGYGDKDSALVSLTAPYRNKFESTLDLDSSNIYSVPTQRTSQAFDTQDDILAAIMAPPQDLGLVSRHNSLDRNRRHSLQKYRRYIENSTVFNDIQQRPGSAQPPSYDNTVFNDIQQRPGSAQPPSYDNCTLYKNQPLGIFPYQEQQQQSHLSAYPFHHPHHYHHHRIKSPTQDSQSHYTKQDENLYQQNLKLCAADAMYLGAGKQTQYVKKQQTLASPTSLQLEKPQTKKWPELPVQGRSPYDSGLVSPSSGTERNWPPSKPQHGVQTSISVDSFQSHLGPSPNVDVVTYGQFQPYWEETKPYETSDFYKYSTKHRKQHQAASQNLHAKLIAWKANQSNTQFPGGVPPPLMSPVLERSRTASPACSTMSANSQQASIDDCEKSPSNKMKTEGSLHQSIGNEEQNVTSDVFHKDVLDWFSKQEKGKKTTLV